MKFNVIFNLLETRLKSWSSYSATQEQYLKAVYTETCRDGSTDLMYVYMTSKVGDLEPFEFEQLVEDETRLDMKDLLLIQSEGQKAVQSIRVGYETDQKEGSYTTIYVNINIIWQDYDVFHNYCPISKVIVPDSQEEWNGKAQP